MTAFISGRQNNKPIATMKKLEWLFMRECNKRLLQLKKVRNYNHIAICVMNNIIYSPQYNLVKG